MFCFTFNMHIHGMYDNSLRTWCSGVALSGSLRLIRRRGLYPPVNIIKTPEGKGDLWLRVSVSEYETQKERRVVDSGKYTL